MALLHKTPPTGPVHEKDFNVNMTKAQVERFPALDEKVLDDKQKFEDYDRQYRSSWIVEPSTKEAAGDEYHGVHGYRRQSEPEGRLASIDAVVAVGPWNVVTGGLGAARTMPSPATSHRWATRHGRVGVITARLRSMGTRSGSLASTSRMLVTTRRGVVHSFSAAPAITCSERAGARRMDRACGLLWGTGLRASAS
jgi:hypothetical protein